MIRRCRLTGRDNMLRLLLNSTATGQETKLSTNSITVVTSNLTEQISYWAVYNDDTVDSKPMTST